MIKNILITGEPKSGKSLLLKSVISGITEKIGFITQEIRGSESRIGFELVDYKGNKSIFAHIDMPGPIRVGKYGLDAKALDSMVSGIAGGDADTVFYIDEIGQMQLLSESFRKLVYEFADSENIFMATISKIYEDDLIAAMKKRRDALIIEVSADDPEKQRQFLSDLIGKIRKARKYILEPARFVRTGDSILMNSKHASRKLVFSEGRWKCDCDFHVRNDICSHSMAASELYKL